MDPNDFQRASAIVNSWDEIGCSEPLTLPYRSFEDKKCFVDVYLPKKWRNERPVPILLYFHGGGMTVGNRRCWFPTWMLKRAIQAGYAFASADYRLMPPASGQDILQDIHHIFRFLADDLNGLLHPSFKVDPTSIIVAGSSAGGFCAHMAALHAKPRPVAVLSMYGMGGDVLTPQYLVVKSEPFFMGREILDISSFRHYLFPFLPENQHTADSRLAYDPTTGIPSNARMPLCRILLQEGIWLDYWTGDYNEFDDSGRIIKEGFSRRILSIMDNAEPDKTLLRDHIPPNLLHLFPQFHISSDFPPSFLVHGELDSAVKSQESFNLKMLLDRAGVKAHLRIIPGQEHSFDYAPETDTKYKDLFDDIFAFLSIVLREHSGAVSD